MSLKAQRGKSLIRTTWSVSITVCSEGLHNKCLLDLQSFLDDVCGGDAVIIWVHGSVPDLDNLRCAWQSINSCISLTINVCDEDMPHYLPSLQRLMPVYDAVDGDNVVSIDIQAYLAERAATHGDLLPSRLRRQKRSNGVLERWLKKRTCLGYTCSTCVAGNWNVRPYARVLSADQQRWHFDCEIILSTKSFRCKWQDSGCVTFNQFISDYLILGDFQCDVVLLHNMYVLRLGSTLRQRPLHDINKSYAALRECTLTATAKPTQEQRLILCKSRELRSLAPSTSKVFVPRSYVCTPSHI